MGNVEGYMGIIWGWGAGAHNDGQQVSNMFMSGFVALRILARGSGSL